MSQAGIINVIDNNPSIPIMFDADTGTATAIGNIIVITGTGGITTSASGNTITIDGSALPKTITGNTGGPRSPSAGNWNITTSNATPIFAGSGSTLNLDFLKINLGLGTALPALTTGTANIIIVSNSGGLLLTSGFNNTFLGSATAINLRDGSNNTIIGYQAGSSITSGSSCTAMGSASLLSYIAGGGANSNNSAFGSNTLLDLQTGLSNLALGYAAGEFYTGSESSNIVLMNQGIVGDNNTIRIGAQGSTVGFQNRVFIAGITGVTVSASAPIAVDSNGQLSSLGFGTSGQFLGSNGAGVSPTWKSVSSSQTLTGNSGGALGPSANFNIVTANATPTFVGSGSTLTLDFNKTNLALGTSLPAITSGDFNTIFGYSSGIALTSGFANVFIGASVAVSCTTAFDCVGIGGAALNSLTTPGSLARNTAVGRNCLISLLTGVSNLALGYNSGSAYTTSESSNICINNIGVAAESNTIRIGTAGSGAGQQNRAFMAGITGVTAASSAVVGVNSSGQLSSLGTGTVGQVLTSTGTTSPTWQAPVTSNIVSSFIQAGSGIALTTATNANLTSISLTAGIWQMDVIVELFGNPTVSGAQQISISTTSVTHGSVGDNSVQSTWQTANFSLGSCFITLPGFIRTLASTTTVYLVVSSVFSAGTVTAYGRINAVKIS